MEYIVYLRKMQFKPFVCDCLIDITPLLAGNAIPALVAAKLQGEDVLPRDHPAGKASSALHGAKLRATLNMLDGPFQISSPTPLTHADVDEVVSKLTTPQRFKTWAKRHNPKYHTDLTP